MSDISLSVIIINYKTKDMTLKSVDSVVRHLKNLIDYEIICVDNNSEDGFVEEVKRKYPDISVIENKDNLGFGKANNQGFARARGRSVLLLNSDAFLTDSSVVEMNDFLFSDPRIAVVGGKLIYPEGDVQAGFGYFPTFLFNNFIARKFLMLFQRIFWRQGAMRVHWVSGAYFLVKKSALDQVGTFDEDYWMYYEEVDMCARIKKAGFKVFYFPKSVVVHCEKRGRPSEHKRQVRRKHRDIFYKKHYGEWVSKLISLFEIR